MGMKPYSVHFTLTTIDQFVADELVLRAKKATIIALQGPLGAGKTTITKSFLQQLGIKEVVVSPTFAYVNCYKTASGMVIYHFDLYRIDSLEQFLSLGFEEYLLSKNTIAIIEWPEVIFPLLEVLKKTTSISFVKLEYVDSEDKASENRIAHFW